MVSSCGSESSTKGKLNLAIKLIVGVDAVSAHAHDDGIRLRYRLDSVAEPARFFGSTGGVVFRIKPEHYVFPSIIAERMLLSVAPSQRKSGRFLPFKIRHGLPPVCCMPVLYHSGKRAIKHVVFQIAPGLKQIV